jgi:hypothetical protein
MANPCIDPTTPFGSYLTLKVKQMNISDTIIRAAIVEAGAEFDSHDVIHAIAHENQRLYVAELAAIDSERPFQILHSALGRRIKAICEELGYTGVASRSLDIFGQHSECVRWSRA